MSNTDALNRMVSLYTISSAIAETLTDIPTNYLFFTVDEDTSTGKIYRGGGANKPLQYIGTETATRLENIINIYGHEFDGTQDITNNLSMTGKLDVSTGSIDASYISSENGIFLGNGTIYFKDENGNNLSLKLTDDLSAVLDIETVVHTKMFDSVADIFNPSINDISDDEIGTTYYAKSGTGDINIPETFVLNSNREIVPTSSYIVSSDTPKGEYNYNKGNIIWIDKLYHTDNKSDSDDTESLFSDNSVITSKEYHELRQAVDKLYYILGVDMDAGKVEDSSLSDSEGLDGGEFDKDSEIVSTNYGVILTDLRNNQRASFNDSLTDEKPKWLANLDEPTEEPETDNPDETPDADVIIPDNISTDITEIGEHLVKAIRIKRGKYSDMMDVSNCLLDGELIWCTYDLNYPTQSNKLYIRSTDKFSNPQFFCINSGSSDDADTDKEYLTELVNIEKIDWLTDSSTRYRMDVDNYGKLTISPLATNQQSLSSYYDTSKKRYKIYINSLYCGGLNSNKLMFRPCSHNFVELSNLTNYDINLQEAKISLQYIDRTRYNSTNDTLHWEILPLTGTIKAGGTYLIRGAECAPIDCNTTRLKIETFDQEWRDASGNLMSFDSDCPSFVLIMGKTDINGNYYSCTHDIGDIYANGKGAAYCVDSNGAKDHFLTTIGIENWQTTNSPLYYEKTQVKMSSYNVYVPNALFVQYFSMDGVNQATTAGGSRNNNTDIYVIDLTSNYQEGIEKYYSGKASFENKNLFYNKSDLSSLPNMVMCTFGKRATATTDYGASRCFNWLSVGYYNEYLKLTYPDGTVKYFESFKGINQNIYTGQKSNSFTVTDNKYNSENSRFSYTGIYDRYRTLTTGGVPFTVHKLIIDDLQPGEYKYSVGKEEGWSDEYTFTVLSDAEINERYNNGGYVSFIHHSDQQGFNKDEYKAWEYIVEYIMNAGIEHDFSINTGDVTQNGNRINEWLDYYSCGKKLFNHSECMHTVGNNDLSPANNTKLGDGGDDSKINPKNFDIFFCHDLSREEQDLLTIVMNNGTYRLIPANYSFDYANCHFICINSELPKEAIMRLFNENADDYLGKSKDQIPNYDKLKEQYSTAVAERIEAWLDNDCSQITNYNHGKSKDDQKWIIAYCHEMPFTILTHAITTGHQPDRLNVKSSSIAGCRINGIKSNGKYYWLSRLFDKYHIPLILGGHKHTYSVSAHIKENIIINADGTEDYSMTYKPIIQLKRSELATVYGSEYSIDELKTLWYNAGKAMNSVGYETVFEDNICDFDDIEIIDDISDPNADYSAPVYAMQTAAGYKLISNKELPAVVLPWLTAPAKDKLRTMYFPATAEPKVNKNQLYPYFTVYKFNNREIVGTPIRMSKTDGGVTTEIYYTGNTKSKGTYDLINKSYTPEEISKWRPDIANGLISENANDKLQQHLIKITNKPF